MRNIDLGIAVDITPLESEMALEEWDLGPLLTRISADRASLSEREWEAIQAVLRAQNEGQAWRPAHRTPVPAWRLSQRRRVWAYRFHKLRASKSSKTDAYKKIAAEDRITVRTILTHFSEMKKAEPEAWEGEKLRVKKDERDEKRRVEERERERIWAREYEREIRSLRELERESRRLKELEREMCRSKEGPLGLGPFLSSIREQIDMEAARCGQPAAQARHLQEPGLRALDLRVRGT